MKTLNEFEARFEARFERAFNKINEVLQRQGYKNLYCDIDIRKATWVKGIYYLQMLSNHISTDFYFMNTNDMKTHKERVQYVKTEFIVKNMLKHQEIQDIFKTKES